LPCPEVCPLAPGPIAPDSGVAGVPESQAAAVVDPPAPQVTIRVRVPARVTIGQEIEYRISVENTSRAPAHHVVVRNPLPVGARFVRAEPPPATTDPELRWEFGTLAESAKRDITLVLAPTGRNDVTNCARVQFEHGQCVRTEIA